MVPILVGACGGDDDDEVVATTAPTPTTVPVDVEVDWVERRIVVDGDVAFDLNFCDGEAPVLCVSRDGAQLGVLELGTYEGEAVADFDAWADDFYESMRADRIAACDPDYELDGDVPRSAPFARRDGIRYGFTGLVDDRVVERVIGHAVNDGADLRVLVANALADDGCLARESELPLAVLDELEPVVAAIAAGSSFG